LSDEIGNAVPLTYEQFRFAFANAVSEDEAKKLYETFAVPASGKPLFQAASANLNPWTEAKVDTKNPERGPLLIIDGEKDNTVPWAIANASFTRQQRNEGVTEIVTCSIGELAGRSRAGDRPRPTNVALAVGLWAKQASRRASARRISPRRGRPGQRIALCSLATRETSGPTASPAVHHAPNMCGWANSAPSRRGPSQAAKRGSHPYWRPPLPPPTARIQGPRRRAVCGPGS
jgi:hypothetical protein